MPFIKDLIAIPERVHQGDFVLKLTSGVAEAAAEKTLNDYVVTPQLADAFKNARGFIQQAVQSGNSKAAYLHGSFGFGRRRLHRSNGVHPGENVGSDRRHRCCRGSQLARGWPMPHCWPAAWRSPARLPRLRKKKVATMEFVKENRAP